ncbi:MAG: cell division protein ZapB [Acidobacteriota bacterium]|jgi:seryl-tRNA synthetase|nr:MAG: hypothetical protein DIU54_10505 [Acidobacteriota bacterium]
MSRTAAAPDVLPIDRLEEKVRQLVDVIDSLRADRARAEDEIARLQHELEASRAKLAEVSTISAELATLREERDRIRERVSEMIAQIDKLNL